MGLTFSTAAKQKKPILNELSFISLNLKELSCFELYNKQCDLMCYYQIIDCRNEGAFSWSHIDLAVHINNAGECVLNKAYAADDKPIRYTTLICYGDEHQVSEYE